MRLSRLFHPTVPPSDGFWGLAAILAILFMIVEVGNLITLPNRQRIGDGRHVESYGFDLSTCLIPRDAILAAGMPKDGIPAISDPSFLTPDEVEALNQQVRGSYLVPNDRVIGVEIAGQARAYPLRVLNWHEVVNDRLGDVPIAVTYNPLCDSAVFMTGVGTARRLHWESVVWYNNSNTLLYDRRDGTQPESLWIQLTGTAVSGAAAQEKFKLTVITCDLVTWRSWLERYPQTSVLAHKRI
jgi:hypothetical protein